MEQELAKRPRRTSQQIKLLLKEFTQANLSTKEFCILHALSEAAFYKWRSRYADGPSANKNTFIQLKSSSVLAGPSALFAEVKGIRLYQPVSACYLKELLA